MLLKPLALKRGLNEIPQPTKSHSTAPDFLNTATWLRSRCSFKSVAERAAKLIIAIPGKENSRFE